ncbi:MAG TPA: phenylacetyl CoA [Azospirillum sp.]|nr:phenylacetyl CoA [Azospirillum sp.]
MNIGTIPKLQRAWDLRAACNFIGGGTGTGLLVFAAISALAGWPFAAAGLVALAFVGFGLSMVWLEIGKPLRAVNVFFHPQTSWMTREGIVALPLFALAALAVVLALGRPDLGRLAAPVMAVAAAIGLGFLYCQARILRAAKGIRAWSEPAILPLILTSGLAEGAGVYLVLIGLMGAALPWASALALALCAARYAAWRHYRARLGATGAPAGTLAALHHAEPLVAWAGHAAPAVLLVLALAGVLPDLMAVLAGIALAVTGWFIKVTIVLRAAQSNGFAVVHTPVRGRGTSRAGDRPGWQLPHQKG